MRLPTALDSLTVDERAALVYGQPYETVDGTTIITVAKVRTRTPDGASPDTRARPVGVFVIRGGEVIWQPAVDATRISSLGLLIGLVSASLAALALVRRPPWPDLTLPGWSPAENPGLRRRN